MICWHRPHTGLLFIAGASLHLGQSATEPAVADDGGCALILRLFAVLGIRFNRAASGLFRWASFAPLRYADWLRRSERIERTRELARYAADVSRANGSTIADGAASIASGKLLELLELVDEATGETKLDAEALVNISRALAALRGSEQTDVKLGLEKIKVSQKGEEISLAREKYQRETCELFLKWHADKHANELASADTSNADKIEKLGQLMFGDTWQPAEIGNRKS